MSIGHVIAWQVLVIVWTRVGSLTPFEGGLTRLACEVIDRSLERGFLARCPVPSEVGERLMVGTHTRVADDLIAISVHGLVAPVGVVEVGFDKVVGLLYHWGRTAALRWRTEEGEIKAVLVVDFLLHGEEVTVSLIEGAFGVALARITA